MKTNLLLTLFLFFGIYGFSQTYPIDTYDGMTVTTCSGTFVDSDDCFIGASTGLYCPGESYTITFCAPTPGDAIRLDFLTFATETGADELTVYDGATLIGTYSGLGTAALGSGTFIGQSGCLTFVFTADANGTIGSGWQASITCASPPTSCNGNQPASDDCTNAPQICNFDGYCGSTSSWYAPDSEHLENGVFCGTIENNSWLSFVASGTSASLTLEVTEPVDPGITCDVGIQIAIFDNPAGDCSTFGQEFCQSPIMGTQTISATGLTPGETYYVMIDGYAGDYCDYEISANTGIQIVDITSSAGETLCPGECTDLTVNATGATGYSWSSNPAGASGSSSTITVCPTATTTYSVDVFGICGMVQTADITLNVVNPTVDFGAQSTLSNLGTYDMNVFTPNTVSCTDPAFYLVAEDSVDAGNYITPALLFNFVTDANTIFDGTSIRLYAGGPPGVGTLIFINNPAPSNTNLTIYPSGGYMNPSGDYYVEICDVAGNGGVDYEIVDGNTNVSYASGALTSGNPCEVIGPLNPVGTSNWTSTAPGASYVATSQGIAMFDPSIAGPGTYDFTYSWDDGVGCSGTATHSIQVVSPYDASWNAPAAICENASSINLNTLITGSTGGSWSGTGVSGNTFNPSGLAGSSVTITYTVGSPSSCAVSESHTITVDPIPTATVSGGGTICAGDPIPDVSIALTGTGPWSVTYSDGSSSTTVNPSSSPYVISGGADGTYTVTAISDANCTGTSSGSGTITTNPLPTATISGGGTICAGDPIPNVSIALTGTGPWTVTYSDGSSSATVNPSSSPYIISGGADGTYTVTAVSDANCTGTSSGSATITTNSLPTATVSGGGTICAGSVVPNVSIALTGTGPWTVTYTDGSTSTTVNPSSSPYIISGGADGTYTVTSVSDVNCTGTSSGSATITTNPLPTATVSGGGTICAGDAIPDVSIALTGTGPWTVTYTDGSTSTTVNPSSSPYVISGGGDGTYIVTAVSDANCTGTSSGSATITTNPLPAAPTVGADATYCDGETIADLFAAGSGGTLNWYSDAGLTNNIGSGTSLTPANTIGTTTYYVTETLNGCEGPSSMVTITINEVPTITSEIPTDVTGCGMSDGTIDITASGGTGSYSYSIDGGSTFGNITGNFSGLGVNSYQVVVDDGNCQVQGSLLVIAGPGIPPAPTAGTDATYCEGESISDLTASAGTGGTLTWYDDAGLTNQVGTGTSFTPSSSVGSYTYYVTETVASCESPSSQVTVVINPTPVAPVLSGGATYCDGDPITDLTANAGGANTGTFYWFDDAGLTNQVGTGPVYSPAGGVGSATYYVVDSLSGCGGASASVTVTVNPTPAFTVSTQNPSSCGGTDGEIILSGLTPSETYNVTYSDGSTVVGPSAMTANGLGEITISNLDAGSYSTIVVELNGCSVTEVGPYSLNDPNAPLFSIAGTLDPTGCGTVDGEIYITGLDPNTSYNLTYDLNGNSSGVISITTDGNGDYTVGSLDGGVYDNFTIELNGCVTTVGGPFTLSPIVPVAPVAGTDATYCLGESIVDLTATSGGGGVLTWYDDAGLTNQIGTGATYAPAVTTAGTYNYYVTETLNGCEGPATMIVIVVNDPPVAPSISGTGTYCPGETITDLVASGAGGTFTWYDDATLTNQIGTGSTLTPGATIGSTTYYVVEVDGNGCASASASFDVSISNGPTASFTPSPSSGSVPLDVSFTNASTNGTTYSWNFGDNSTSTDFNPDYTYENTGEFVAVLTVIDSLGCEASDSALIIVEGEAVVVIPNIFSPNGDGNNDLFLVSGTNIVDVDGSILNRWGQVVYAWNALYTGWDGRTLTGTFATEGTYYYLIKVTAANGEVLEFQGPLQLVR